MPIRLPKTLSIPPSLKPKPPRIQIRTLHFQGRFSSARMLPLQDRLENPVHPAPRIFQIANQYHTLPSGFSPSLRLLPKLWIRPCASSWNGSWHSWSGMKTSRPTSGGNGCCKSSWAASLPR